MRVRVLYFSVLRGVAGRDEEVVDFGGRRVGELLAELGRRHEGLTGWEGRLLVARNRAYVGAEEALEEGDEVALMPPVQGG